MPNAASAIDIGNSELPYIKIKTISSVLNEPKIAGEMEIYINQKNVPLFHLNNFCFIKHMNQLKKIT